MVQTETHFFVEIRPRPLQKHINNKLINEKNAHLTVQTTKTVHLHWKAKYFFFVELLLIFIQYFLEWIPFEKTNSFLWNCHAVSLVNSTQLVILLFQALI